MGLDQTVPEGEAELVYMEATLGAPLTAADARNAINSTFDCRGPATSCAIPQYSMRWKTLLGLIFSLDQHVFHQGTADDSDHDVAPGCNVFWPAAP